LERRVGGRGDFDARLRHGFETQGRAAQGIDGVGETGKGKVPLLAGGGGDPLLRQNSTPQGTDGAGDGMLILIHHFTVEILGAAGAGEGRKQQERESDRASLDPSPPGKISALSIGGP
jgi:hypothetical protein